MNGSAHAHSQSSPASDFKQIAAPSAPYLEALGRFLSDQVSAFEPSVRELVAYTLGNSGKRIRPILTCFSGWQNEHASVPDEALVRVGAVLELVHLATLVHDDILDEASLRHKRPTAAQKFGKKAAVLLGDTLFAQALKLAADFDDVAVCRAVSLATRRVCAGEIQQTLRPEGKLLDREDYLEVIQLKTGELFRVSCRLGALYGGYGESFAGAAETFGLHLGIAYQIYDDLADILGEEERIGKTLGTDVASGKMTLPLLFLLEQLGESERTQLMESLRQPGQEIKVSPSSRAESLGTLSELLVKHQIPDRVAAFFEDEVDKAEAALSAHATLPPVEKLRSITGFIRQQIHKLNRRAPLPAPGS
jgi:octaprenyl-diphosphate synthase